MIIYQVSYNLKGNLSQESSKFLYNLESFTYFENDFYTNICVVYV